MKKQKCKHRWLLVRCAISELDGRRMATTMCPDCYIYRMSVVPSEDTFKKCRVKRNATH